MNNAIWTGAEQADCAALDWDAFRERWPGRSFHAWRHKRRELLRGDEPAPARTVSPPPDEANPAELLRRFAEYQREARKLCPVRDRIEVDLPVDRPVGVAFLSDLHVGGAGVDHDTLLAHVSLIEGTRGLFCCVGGDWVNNFLPDKLKHAGWGDMRPAEQWQVARWLARRLAPKLLFAGSGNHDAWTQRAADFDPLLECLRDIPTVYTGKTGLIGEGGTVDLTVGRTAYRIYRKHRGRSNRNNPLAGPLALFKDPEVPGVDVNVTEHIHSPAVGSWEFAGRTVVGIVTGSYKVRDEHAREGGFYRGGVSAPTVVFWPHERRLTWCPTLDDAADLLSHWW